MKMLYNKGGSMNKVFVMAAIILSLGIGQAWAVNATEAINPEAQPVLNYGKYNTGIEKIVATPVAKWITTSTQISNTPIRIRSITIYGDTLGDMVAVYDTTSTTTGNMDKWLEFEIAISANTSSTTAYLGDVKMTKGCYLTMTDVSASRVSIIYDY